MAEWLVRGSYVIILIINHHQDFAIKENVMACRNL